MLSNALSGLCIALVLKSHSQKQGRFVGDWRCNANAEQHHAIYSHSNRQIGSLGLIYTESYTRRSVGVE